MAHGDFTSTLLSDALVILGAAGIVIPVFARFRITPVIGFILVGLLVGPYGLGKLVYEHHWLGYITITDPEGLEPFAEFGIILLLFTIGLELSFNRLWQMRRLVFGLGALELLVIAQPAHRISRHARTILDRRARAWPGPGSIFDGAGAANFGHSNPGRQGSACHAAVRGYRHRPDHLPAWRACTPCRIGRVRRTW